VVGPEPPWPGGVDGVLPMTGGCSWPLQPARHATKSTTEVLKLITF